jgi:carbon monoxide dehydrogenase subunit G
MAMIITGEVVLQAGREAVWTALNDLEVLKRCIPGCDELAQLSETEFEAVVKIAVGPLKASFKGRIQLSNTEPGKGYGIAAEGQGGVAGFAKEGATVQLSDVPEGTCLSYDVEAQVGGKIAQLGSRLIHGVAEKNAHEFFSNFASILAPTEAA